jgi:hypothetical protein
MRHSTIHARLFFGLFCALLCLPAFGQDARSLALGGCGSGLNWGPTALVWNPAALQFSIPEKGWAISTSGTSYDSNNTGGAALDYNLQDAAQANVNPIQKYQSYQGLAAVQMQSAAGGILYDQESNSLLGQDTANFFNDRNRGSLRDNAYSMEGSSKEERISTLALGYSQALPLGQMSAAVGGTLKIHQGSLFNQTLLSGSFTKGQDGGYNYQQWTATSGTGFSWDAGLMFKPTANIQLGLLLADINSNYKWKAEYSQIILDPITGAQKSSEPSSETVQSDRPRITRIGITLHNQDSTSLVSMESVHQEGETYWHFGFERMLPAQHLAIRLGTFKDITEGHRIWTAGIGYYGRKFEVDLGGAATKIPVIQDSTGFGLGLSFSMLL